MQGDSGSTNISSDINGSVGARACGGLACDLVVGNDLDTGTLLAVYLDCLDSAREANTLQGDGCSSNDRSVAGRDGGEGLVAILVGVHCVSGDEVDEGTSGLHVLLLLCRSSLGLRSRSECVDVGANTTGLTQALVEGEKHLVGLIVHSVEQERLGNNLKLVSR